MNGKILCIGTILVATLIVLGSLSPHVYSKEIDNVIVEVNRYYGRKSEPIYTELSYDEAVELKEILIQLNVAIENNDEDAISQYEKTLNEKGIFGSQRQEFFSQNTFSEKMDLNKYSVYPRYLKQKSGDNISNNLCYFNAIGKGGIFFMLAIKFLDAIKAVLNNASSFIEAFVILIALLPLFVLIYLLTHLIPFRILMPVGVVSMQDGRMSSLGLQGFKRVIVDNETYNVNISGFTGLTINFIGSESLAGFLFVSGIAMEVKETSI